MENMQTVAVGDKFQIEIRKQGINGEGIGYHHKLAVFVPGAILRELVDVEIVEIKPGYAIAKIEKIVKESIRRIQPPCQFYEKCGGCQMQHIRYKDQLSSKQSILQQSLKRYTDLNVDALEIRAPLGMEHNFAYRNKSQMPFKNTNMGLALGLYEANSNKFVFVDDCLVQDPIVNAANASVLEILKRNHLSAFDAMNQEGILLNLVTRYVQSTESLQITMITTTFKPILREIAKQIITEIPHVKGVFFSENKQHNTLMFGKTVECLAGETYITEKIGDLTIKLSPDAFHQLNTAQMNVLYAEILKAAALTGKETVIDGFCGVGITTMQVAHQAKMVYGIDYSQTSIKDAIANAAMNKIKNIEFFADRVEKIMPQLIAKAIRPDIIIFDPPRSGLEASVITEVLSAKIPKIIYVSCNPSTLAKNLASLIPTYQIKYIQPIDMFPHTASVESIVLLQLKKAQ
jgi:tRNA (uracil-5-)-methyltransferase